MIRRLVNELLASNTWICPTSVPGEAIVIDPGLPVEPVLDALAEEGCRAVAVLLTHGHFDHVGSAAVLRERHGAIVALHAADRRALNAVNFHLMDRSVNFRILINVVRTTGEIRRP